MGIIRLIKPFFVVAGVLFLVITLLSLLITRRPRVSRTVFIAEQHKGASFKQVRNLYNWKNWHPAFKDSGINIRFIDSNNCDIKYRNKISHLLITKKDTSSVYFLLTTAGESDVENKIQIVPAQQAGIVAAEWVATTHLNWYPWDKFYAIFVDKLTGPGYEAALQALKDFIELK